MRSLLAHLQVGQLPEGLAAHVALVLDLAVLLLQRVRQGLVARRAHAALHLAQVDGARQLLLILLAVGGGAALGGVAQEG